MPLCDGLWWWWWWWRRGAQVHIHGGDGGGAEACQPRGQGRRQHPPPRHRQGEQGEEEETVVVVGVGVVMVGEWGGGRAGREPSRIFERIHEPRISMRAWTKASAHPYSDLARSRRYILVCLRIFWFVCGSSADKPEYTPVLRSRSSSAPSWPSRPTSATRWCVRERTCVGARSLA